MARNRLGALLVAALLATQPAVADPAPEPPRVAIRTGVHPGFSRLVFDWPAATRYTAEQDGSQVELRFNRPGRLDAAALARLPRNLVGFETTERGALLRLRPGVRLRHMTLGNRVVIDLLDPEAPREAAEPARPATAEPPRAITTEARQQAAGPRRRGRGNAPADAPAPAATPAPAVEAPAPALAARQEPPPAVVPPAVVPPASPPRVAPATPAAAAPAAVQAAPATTIRLPFAAASGGAALTRGNSLLLVFDESRDLEPAALRRLGLPAEVVPVPGATVLRLPADTALTLRRDDNGWVLTPSEVTAGPISLSRSEEGTARLLLRTEGASRVIAVPDPETGGLLLVGTITGAPRAVPELRRFVAFDLLPTRLGVALALRSDETSLRAGRNGFSVPLAEAGPLALGPAASPGAMAAETISRVLDLHDRPLPVLLERRRSLLMAISSAPPQGRGAQRLDLAETLLALGLGAEAQQVALLAAAEDPRLAPMPRTLLVAGAAAVLAGRPEEAADALGDPRLPAEGEAALWRGLARASEEPGELAPGFASAAPLVLAYPAALRSRLLPLVAVALAEGGAHDVATSLLDTAGDSEEATSPLARYARARLREARGEAEAALALYGALAQGRDRDARARAMGRMVELRLATGRIDAAGAAAALEAAIPSWRGDRRELARRLRAAELRLQAGQPAMALALLRETETLFPDAAEALRPRIGAATIGVLGDPATPALEAAQLYAERRDTLPVSPELDIAVTRVAERLAALDLQGEAVALLRRVSGRSADQAALAVRLGEALLANGDAAGALTALRVGEGSAALPGELGRRRALAEAGARAMTGDHAGAVAVLRGMGPEGAAPLADLLAARQDWAGAAQALAQHVTATLPPAPAPLDTDARQMLLRLGAFYTLAGDEAGLRSLRESQGPRMAGGPLAEAFAAVTGSTRGGVTDLARLRQEVALARALPEQLRALR